MLLNPFWFTLAIFQKGTESVHSSHREENLVPEEAEVMNVVLKGELLDQQPGFT